MKTGVLSYHDLSPGGKIVSSVTESQNGSGLFGNIQKELNMTKEKTDKNKVSYMVRWIVSQSFLHLVGGYIGASFGMVGLKCLRVTVVRSTECHVLRMANRDSCNAYVYINIC